MSIFQPVIFKLEGETYGMDIAYVNSIEHEQQIVRVPNSSDIIKGIVNLRGEIIPVIDLRVKFKVENTNKQVNTELVVINLETNKIALEVDAVEEIQNIDADDIVEMPVIAKGDDIDYFENVAKVGDKLIIMINPINILSKDEAIKVKKIVDDSAK